MRSGQPWSTMHQPFFSLGLQSYLLRFDMTGPGTHPSPTLEGTTGALTQTRLCLGLPVRTAFKTARGGARGGAKKGPGAPTWQCHTGRRVGSSGCARTNPPDRWTRGQGRAAVRAAPQSSPADAERPGRGNRSSAAGPPCFGVFES